ncbi:Callose synthase 2 [Dendrobium catenatum]|uniref:Callose synthase 2 n=1 Tax=Dendrobium catenatum TaxID=906689 RepID=A0A2I0VTU7_9ASPA|nr:Callose synthase 2 [Dendrobium catenatum]
MSSSRNGPEQQSPPRWLLCTKTMGNLGELIFDSEVVSSSLVEIAQILYVPSPLVEFAPILRVAKEVEATYPKVAYLCKLSSVYGGEDKPFLERTDESRTRTLFRRGFFTA